VAVLPTGRSPLRGGTLTELESVVITEQYATLLPPRNPYANNATVSLTTETGLTLEQPPRAMGA